MSELPSYRKINYALRPAKNVERKMIAEACSRLGRISKLDAYRYIGFGSTFFSDFRLFHKLLGFLSMISIEREVDDAERIEFNNPFGCITIRIGESSEVLPEVEWKDIPTIVWLDYDSILNTDKLDDISYLVANLAPFSVLITTVRAKANDFGNPNERLTKLSNDLGTRVPSSIGKADLIQYRFPQTLKGIIDANVEATLETRNAGLPQQNRYEYQQIFNFEYNDGTPMLTIGGVLVQKNQASQFDSCDFDSLKFCRKDAPAYKIVTPGLTYKELQHLDAQLPGGAASSPGVPSKDIEAYTEIYRYFPTFAEAEL